MKSIETVGILGLGKMGCPIAAHLVAKGFKVVGYDPLEEARRKAVALGARSAASAREAAHASDLVIIVVGFDSEVEEVLFGKERSEEHTSELQSLAYLVCRLLLEKKKNQR